MSTFTKLSCQTFLEIIEHNVADILLRITASLPHKLLENTRIVFCVIL